MATVREEVHKIFAESVMMEVQTDEMSTHIFATFTQCTCASAPHYDERLKQMALERLRRGIYGPINKGIREVIYKVITLPLPSATVQDLVTELDQLIV